MRKHLLALHEEYGHASYPANLLAMFAVVFPALRAPRDLFDRAEDRVAHFVNHVLERARTHTRLTDAAHHVFCSEWAALVYKRLGLTKPDFDPRVIAPVEPLVHRQNFAEPIFLVPEEVEKS